MLSGISKTEAEAEAKMRELRFGVGALEDYLLPPRPNDEDSERNK
jgi:hypothetical protein